MRFVVKRDRHAQQDETDRGFGRHPVRESAGCHFATAADQYLVNAGVSAEKKLIEG